MAATTTARRAWPLVVVGALVLAACQPVGGGGRNHLGTGPLFTGADREDVWLAVSGPCSSAEQGDLVSAVSDGNYSTATNPPPVPSAGGYVACEGSGVEVNPDHSALGYTYTVAVPPTYAGGALDVEIFDAGYCANTSAAGDQSGGGFTTTFELVGPVTATAAPVVASFHHDGDPQCEPTCEAGGPGLWCNLHTIAAPAPGATYVLNVRTSAEDLATSGSHGTNQFGLRVVEAGSAGLCSAQVGDAAYDPDCPAIRADGWAGYLLGIATAAPSFSIARVPEAAAGKVLRVWAWDLGEGSDQVRLLDPAGQARTFDWQVVDRSGADVAPTGGWAGTTASLDVSGMGHPQPGYQRLSSGRYNDRLLVLDVALGDDAAALAGEWRLEVQADSASADRFTLRTAVVASGTPLPPGAGIG
jgi:hypothetical protein